MAMMEVRRRARPGPAAWGLVASVVLALATGMPVLTEATHEPPLAWQVKEPGRGTPAADDERVFFLTVDQASGLVRWRRPLGGPTGETMGARVLVDAGVVIAGDYEVWAFDAASGAPRWTWAPRVGTAPGLYLGGTANGLVFTGSSDGHLTALDIRSGRVVWTRRVIEQATVFAPVVSDAMVVASFTEPGAPARGGVAAFDAASGRERWRRRLLPLLDIRSASGATGEPLLTSDTVVVGAQDGTVVGLEPGTGQFRWAIPGLRSRPDGRILGPHDFRPVVRVGGRLITGSLTGQVVAYDTHTRREQWRQAPVPASVAFGLAADEHTVYVPFLSGQLVAMDAQHGSERWRIGGASAGFVWTPLVSHSRLFVLGSGAGLLSIIRRVD
jgi:outer membrane protein assembly factor BamB